MQMEVDELTTTASSSEALVEEVKVLLWGSCIQQELFHRWSQGFIFSPDEPTALVQREGGPCAVIAPVQAFLLRALMKEAADGGDPDLLRSRWRTLSSAKVDGYLVQALTEILRQVANPSSEISSEGPTTPSAKLKLAKLQEDQKGQQQQSHSIPVSVQQPHQVPSPPPGPTTNPYCIVFLNQPLSRRISIEADSSPEGGPPAMANGPTSSPSPTDRRPQRTEEQLFHRNLRLQKLSTIAQVEDVIKEKLETFKGYYGILQFLYSVVLTKGVAKLGMEMSESSELIDPTHGHGSQSMTNLLLSGQGVNYIWDNDKDVGGLQLKGIERQCQVGFLTLLEKLRLCEVGSFLKNPKYPVWVLGSETHLTVLFSWNMDLVRPETPAELARRVFQTFDPEGNNFIQSVLLEDVMKTLDLFADTEYVEIMKKKLDPETLGVILLNDFMEEFFQNERGGTPDTFTIYHYNGLSRSSTRKVTYCEGAAIILESDLRCMTGENELLTCLQTKWPNIDVQWKDGHMPSIN